MDENKKLITWITSGVQRRAVLQALAYPMTYKQIEIYARRFASKIRDTDVARILKELLSQGLLYSLNPDDKVGRLYYLTEKGRSVVASVFHLDRIKSRPLTEIDWHAYGKIMSTKTKHSVFTGVTSCLEWKDAKEAGVTVTEIRKTVNPVFPIGLPSVLKTIQHFECLRIVRCAGRRKKKKHSKVYNLTDSGKKIAEEIRKNQQVFLPSNS